ncbi:MAG TPA: hypothetical protein VE076_07365 [Nitrososphaeraceae archaeon]|nr:hypothetical protein [Nitrososphaeraceae archaeon]
MARSKQSNLICPNHEVAGTSFFTERTVKANTVTIPKLSNVQTLSEALNYASKICFRLHIDMIRFPPSEEHDRRLADNLYKDFSKFTPHSKKQIEEFESRQLERLTIKRRKEQQQRQTKCDKKESEELQAYNEDHDYMNPPKKKYHVPLPPDTGRITRSSIALLYGGLVFLVISSWTRTYQHCVEAGYTYTRSISTLFSLLVSDDRNRISVFDWFAILLDVENHGFNAARSMNAKKDYEGRGYKISVKQIKRKIKGNKKMLKENLMDLSEAIALYEYFRQVYSDAVNNDQRIKKVFLEVFEEYENDIESNLREDRYFIGHGSGNKKRKWCFISLDKLADIKYDNPLYKQYESIMRRFVEAYNDVTSPEHEKRHLIRYMAYRHLEDLGWRRKWAYDKVLSDFSKETCISLDESARIIHM